MPSEDAKDLDRRAEHFVDMYKNGQTIAPILVHRLPSGEYRILDGHARAEAYRRLGVTSVPAIENLSLSGVTEKIKKIGAMGVRGFKGAYHVGKGAVKEAHKLERGITRMRTERALYYAQLREAQLRKMKAEALLREARLREERANEEIQRIRSRSSSY